MAPYRVCFGCVTDGKLVYQRQAVVLLASLRRLGGEYANSDFFFCTTDAVAPELTPYLTTLRARLIHVPPVSTRLPATGKLRFLELPDIVGHDYAVLMDCDTAIAMPPDGLFGGAGVRARMAGGTSVPPEVLAELFARTGLPLQEARYWTAVKRERTPIYVNSGVVVVAAAAAPGFAGCWARHQNWLLDHPELLPGCARHTNQASLAVALVDSGIAFEPLDIGFNFPVHRAPPAFYASEIDALAPTILHYDLTDEDGSLRPSPAAAADAAITRVNHAWRSTRAGLTSPADIAGES